MSIADLRFALNHIKANPREWDQSLWFCDTTACLAGHLVLLDGWEPIEDEDGDEGYHIINGDQTGTVDSIACSIAGILGEEGDVLWNGDNSLDQLEALIRRLEADQAIYGTMSQPISAWQHCWTNSRGTVIAAAHRRTSYIRVGRDVIERKDHDSRTEAAEYAYACTAGMSLTAWRSEALAGLAAA